MVVLGVLGVLGVLRVLRVMRVLGLVLVVVAVAATAAILAHIRDPSFLLLIVFHHSRVQHLHLLLGPTTVSFHD